MFGEENEENEEENEENEKKMKKKMNKMGRPKVQKNSDSLPLSGGPSLRAMLRG